MTNLTRDSAVTHLVELLTRYSFEIQGYTAQGIVAQWLTQYSATWVRLAIVEALYLGRYKAVSIEQILNGWFRRGNPKIHFDREFESLICGKLPQKLANIPNNARSNGGGAGKQYQRGLSGFKKPLYRATSKLPSPTPAAPTRKKLRYSPPPVASSSLSFLTLETIKKAPPASQASGADSKPVENGAAKHSIDRFTPSPDASQFYFKLKAVAQQTTE